MGGKSRHHRLKKHQTDQLIRRTAKDIGLFQFNGMPNELLRRFGYARVRFSGLGAAQEPGQNIEKGGDAFGEAALQNRYRSKQYETRSRIRL